MIRVALKMLIGDRAKYIGILIGITFASFLITQQSAIFTGIMARSFGSITDLPSADVWVMDPKVQYIDDLKPLSDTQLFRVRGVDGVDWAVPLYKGLLKARLSNGTFQTVAVLGVDDGTLIGGPSRMVQGELADLRNADALIVDEVGAKTKLAQPLPDGTSRPLVVGDTLELNDHRGVVVGICKTTRTFQSQPVVYTTFTRATTFAPRERKLLSFVLVHAKAGVSPEQLCARIRHVTGLAAYTSSDFKWLTVGYYMKNTGIAVNFGMSVLLGLLIGTIIAGQTFFNFTLDNLRHFGALKAMGASSWTLVRMILVQAALAGSVGWGLGVGGAAIIGRLTKNTELAFLMPWQLLAISGTAVILISLLSATLAIWKVIRLEPAIVFKG
ncbi:MAG: ABC transporter permease [Planctomycetes bacterium]|nr:ABC transporter permease [Planctomycetota bacterium]